MTKFNRGKLEFRIQFDFMIEVFLRKELVNLLFHLKINDKFQITNFMRSFNQVYGQPLNYSSRSRSPSPSHLTQPTFPSNRMCYSMVQPVRHQNEYFPMPQLPTHTIVEELHESSIPEPLITPKKVKQSTNFLLPIFLLLLLLAMCICIWILFFRTDQLFYGELLAIFRLDKL